MTCDEISLRLTALADGELPPSQASELERHLASCPACAAAQAELAAAARMAAAWTVNAPDIAARVQQSLTPDAAVLDEIRRLQTEMRALREELAALRRCLPRPFDPYALPAPARPDSAPLEKDPWNSLRS